MASKSSSVKKSTTTNPSTNTTKPTNTTNPSIQQTPGTTTQQTGNPITDFFTSPEFITSMVRIGLVIFGSILFILGITMMFGGGKDTEVKATLEPPERRPPAPMPMPKKSMPKTNISTVNIPHNPSKNENESERAISYGMKRGKIVSKLPGSTVSKTA